MDFGSFLLSLGTWLTVLVILVILFTWLSRNPRNKVVYYPKKILAGSDMWDGWYPSQNPFGWVREAVCSTERDVIAASSVDSAVYFVFLITVLKILVVSGVVLLPVLLPLAATESIYKSSVGTFNRLDRLSMAPVKQKTTRLWAFVAATYWVSLVAYFHLWRAYKRVSDMRAAALVSPEFRPEQFAILVRDIPPSVTGQTRQEQVDSFFRTNYPDTFYKSLVITNNIKKVNKIYKKLEEYKKKLTCAEAAHDESKKIQYNGKINELVSKLEAEQKATSPEKQALVFFTSRVTAASVVQSLHGRMPAWTVMDAPTPKEIIWPNLLKTRLKRQTRRYVNCAIIVLTIIIYVCLVGVSSAFSIARIGSDVVKTVIRAYVPHIILIISMLLLSKFLFFLSKAEGIPSTRIVARAACRKYFYFTALNFFAAFTLLGTFFESTVAIKYEQYNTYIEVLGESLPTNAIFFMTFVAMMSFVGYGLELSRIFPLINFHLKRKRYCKTGQELKEAWAPGELGFESRILFDMFVVTIVIGYSVVAPIIIPFGVVYFALGWLVLRNQVLRVYVSSHDTYGDMWPCINTQIVAALFVFQMTMFVALDLKSLFSASLVVIPLAGISILFDYFCRKKYHSFFKNKAREVTPSELNETPDMELILRSYIPPSLNNGKADEDHLEGASSKV